MRRFGSSVRLAVEELENREMPSFGLDTSFGLGGIDLNPVGSQVKFAHIAGVTALPNGSLLTAGNLATSSGLARTTGDVALVRLTGAGAADTSFGGGTGLDVLSASQPHEVTATMVLPDGKILLGGNRSDATVIGNPVSHFFVMRLNADGSRDTTFGAGGEMEIAFGWNDRLTSLAVQADGKIVVAGTTQAAVAPTSPPDGKLAVARLNANGTLDNTFGMNGELVNSPASGDWATAGLAVQPDGKLVVGGRFRTSNSILQSGGKTELMVYRFNADGTPDTSFSGDGLARTNYGSFAYAYANSMALLKDGTIVLGGGSSYGQGLLAWFKADGTLLKAEQFGGTGASASGVHWISSIAAVPQGGVEVLGNSYDGSDFLLEYHPTPGSAANQKELTFTSGFGLAEAIAVQADGKVVVASTSSDGDGLSPNIWPTSNSTHLGVMRFSDQGLAESSATVMRAQASRTSDAGTVKLQVNVVPLLGPADIGTAIIFFREGTTVLGAVTQGSLAVDQPRPSLTIALADGDHTITAEYAGSTQWAASSFTFHLHVESPKVTVALAVSNPTPHVGDSITLKATVQATEDGHSVNPWGPVTFYDGTTMLGTVLAFNNGNAANDSEASLSVNLLTAGTHTLRASYNGSPTNSVTDAMASVTVLPAALGTATVTLRVELPPGAAGNPVLLTAVVQPPTFTGTPLGNVIFNDGSTTLGSAVLNSNGVASLTTTALRPGTHILSVSYAGNAELLPATSAVKRFTVAPALTATNLSVPTGAIVAGQPVVLQANVFALSAGFPIGTVSFMDGSTVLGTAKVDGNGNAKLIVTTLAAGTHSITAVYSGCSTCQASTSSAGSVTITSTVGKTVTQTALTPSIAAPVFGQIERLSAQVTTTAGSPVPAGLVGFYDGAKLLATVALDSAGKAIFDVQLNIGRRSFHAIYLGNATQAGSASATVAQTVAQAGTSIILSGNSATGPSETTFTITAAIHSQFAGSPIGSVTFHNGSTVFGASLVNGNGIAAFKTGPLAAGKHFFTAIYSGCSTFLGATSAVFEVDIG